ncbi:MAG: carbohydrate ABC transporter permease [Bacillus sp. (in: Bacteria)]|nr:carbohydrate ABC transporter permease [Bacillus sp. (in: firmicutes)]
MNKRKSFVILQYSGAVLVTIATLAPFVWLFISSIFYQRDLTAVPFNLFPKRITFGRYVDIFINPDNATAYTFKISMINSLIVAFSVTLIALCVGSLAAYATARLRFPGRNGLLYLFLFTYMMPPVVIVFPLYMILSSKGLINTRSALTLLYLSMVIPYVVWVMRSYFASIPKSFEDAAAIDGCSRFKSLWYIFLPIARPGLIATGLLSFLIAWDEFFFALIFTSTLNAKTIPVAISEFTGKHLVDYGMIATGGMIAIIPPLLITCFFQKYIIQGMIAGGLKE